jgi:hypothetical protein
MGKGLGITTIHMYEDLVNQEFQPIEEILTIRNHKLSTAIELQVKKDLGIYELYQRKATIETELAEIEEQLEKFTKKKDKRRAYGGYETENMINLEVKRRMKELDGALDKVHNVKYELIKRIKLCGANEEIKMVFEEVGDIVKETLADIKKLPDPSKLVKALPVTTKKSKKTGKKK